MEFRILELPGSVATRYCGRLFAEFGAVVVRAGEEPDDTLIGYSGEAGRAYGRWLDAGKVSGTTAAQEPFDLVISWEGGATGEEVGGAVVLDLSWFGATGPYADWPATDEIIMALCGVAYSFGEPSGPPMLPQGHAPQIIAGANATNAGLAALLELPDRRPRRVDVNVYESTMCLSEVATVAALADDRARSLRLGVNRFSPTYPCTSYRTTDGWAGVTCLTPPQWNALCTAIAAPELAADERYSTAFRRLMRGDEVDAVLAAAFARRSTAEWVAEGIAGRIPITPMPRPSELPQQEQWRARGSFTSLSVPERDSPVEAPTLPFRMDFTGTPVPRWTPSANLGPLAGLRVIDFSMGWSGPQATRCLADLGADVIKVESEAHPDWYRGWETRAEAGADQPPPIEVRPSFNTLNRNKKGVVLELDTAEGLARAKELVATADVVIDNFAAGVLDKLGLGHAVQRQVQPDVISASMPAFGSTGPLAAVRAYGSTVEQASGLPFVNGDESWPPCLQHVAVGDPIAGVYTATAILVALAERSLRGGATVDLSQVECLFQVGADAIITEQLEGSPVPRTGSHRNRLGLSTVVAAAGTDTWLAVAAPSGDPQTAAELAAWAAANDVHAAAAELRSRGIAAAPVQPAHCLGDDRQLVATGFWETMQRRYVGEHPLGAPAFRFDGNRPVARCPAPTLGEHTDEVFAHDR